MAYFEGLRTNDTENFVDAEVTSADKDSGGLEYTERELYEATCREGKTLVRRMLAML